MQTFKPGDVVRLRSGSPWSTVESVETGDPSVLLTRFNDVQGYAQAERYHQSLLIKRTWLTALTSL